MNFLLLPLLGTLSALPSVAASAAPADALALPMPPPPAGMKPLSPKEQVALLQRSSVNEEPARAAEIERESADLEAIRRLEQVALESGSLEDTALREALGRMGPGHPLRLRLEHILGDPDHREDALPEVSPVRDLVELDMAKVASRYDIPVEMQPLVAHYVRFFQGPGRRWFRQWVARSTRYIPVMQPILEAHGLPRDTVYLAMIESGFAMHAYSWAHAAGPWQFIPPTGKEYGLKQDFWVDERRDPIKSTDAAARFLKRLHRDLGHWYLAWAGYNTGGSRIRRLTERRGTTDFWVISSGRGLAEETRHYVPKLIAAALVAKSPQVFGFKETEFDYQPPLEFDEVAIPDVTDLAIIAQAAEVSVEAIRDLNPELRRFCTPPATEEAPYRLRVPKGHGPRFTANFAAIPPSQRMKYLEVKIRRGDTLSSLARKHDTTVEAILRFNDLQDARRLKVNATLMIPVPLGTGTPNSRPSPSIAAAPRQEKPRATASTPARSSHGDAVKTEVIGGRTRISYGVQDGDTLWGICRKFNCSVQNLERWNNLSRKGRRLQVGTVLAIWQDGSASGTAPARAAHPGKLGRAQTHQIVAGESLWSISQRYGVSVEDLERWNGLGKNRVVKPGQKLRVVSP